MEQTVIGLEHEMWEAVLRRDGDAFRRLVSPDAVMICGGYRCGGSEYAEMVADFSISEYAIEQMEVVSASEDEVILHYLLRVAVDNSRDADLAGLFHVVSVWKCAGGSWNLILNMDARIVEG